MDPERRFHDQITYWAALPQDQFGNYTFAAPVTFIGRWVDKLQDVYDAHGEVVQSAAQIHYPETVAPLIALQGYMIKGVTAAVNPTDLVGAYQIKDLREIPDLRGMRMQKVAVL